MKELAAQILSYALNAGADMAECRINKHKKVELNADNNRITLMRTTFSSGMSIKVILGNRKGSASITGLDKNDIERAIEAAVEAARVSLPDEAEGIADFIENRDYTYGVADPDRDILYDRTEEFLRELSGNWPKITLDSYCADHVSVEKIYANTNGVSLGEKAGNYHFSGMFYAKEGKKVSSFSSFDFSAEHPDLPVIDCADVRTSLQHSIDSLDPFPIEGKMIGALIVSPECSANLIASALSLYAGDTQMIDKTALWKDKIGEKVTSPLLTVRADPFDPSVCCAARVTGDGYPANSMTIIENGVLKSSILGRYAAKKTGLPRGENDIDTLLIRPGDKSLAELVQGVEDGLLLCRISGGHPSPNGDISAVAKNSFRIHKGKITGAVAETMISGNLSAMLQSIDAISKETVSNGSITVPYLRIRDVTISGK